MDSNKDPIEKLREYTLCKDFKSMYAQYCSSDELADEIEAQYQKLPLDADGVPIRPGDELEPSGLLADVFKLPERIKKTKAWAVNEQGAMLTHPDASGVYGGGFLRHVKPDTVENLLEEFFGIANLPSEAELRSRREIIDGYAERIRKAVQDED